MKIKQLFVIAAMATATCAIAQAQSSYSAALDITEAPKLNFGISELNHPDAVGQWTSRGVRDATVTTQEFLGIGPDSRPLWQDPRHSENLHSVSGPPHSLGESLAHVPLRDSTGTGGQASVFLRGLGASVALGSAWGRGSAQAHWERNFTLNPHSSMSWSGSAALNILGAHVSPLDLRPILETSDSPPGGLASYAEIGLRDHSDRVGAYVNALVFGSYSSRDIFALNRTDTGQLTLTIHNNFDTVMTGTLGAHSFAQVLASPVPEPAGLISMLAGLALISGITRKRQSLKPSSCKVLA